MYRSVVKKKIVCRIWVASILLHHKLDVQQTAGFLFLCLFVWQRLTYWEPALSWSWAQLRKMGENSTSINEFGHLLRRLNIKRGKCAKDKPAALDIVPDSLFVGEFWNGVINSKYFGQHWPYYVWQKLEELGDVPVFGQIWSAWSLCVR